MRGYKLDNQKKAVALSYDSEKDAAPVIVASGSGFLAEQIISAARRLSIPIYEDESAASVLMLLEVGEQVPPELYEVVAKIYAYVLKVLNSSRRIKN